MKKNNLASSWLHEAAYLTRYTGSGALNTAVGFIVIFAAMSFGFSPVVSNIAGYGVGFILGFVVSKRFVFRSEGHFLAESIRYLIAFFASFLLNLLVLRTALIHFQLHAIPAQIIAAISYTVFMYLLTRLFVFKASKTPE